ncbi:MAG TPA: DUF5990 family protein [Mucilaginibacter sp.]|jgi:hypothetical protein
MSLTLHIVLEKPPADIDFGLQKGSGNNYETVQIQYSKAEDLRFVLTAEVKGDRQKDQSPDFKGPFVQGAAMDRFIYIDIGTYAGETDSLFGRRLKIPLIGISWEMVDQLTKDSKAMLQTHVPGTGKDGTPNCATVKPFGGWKVVMLES